MLGKFWEGWGVLTVVFERVGGRGFVFYQLYLKIGIYSTIYIYKNNIFVFRLKLLEGGKGGGEGLTS